MDGIKVLKEYLSIFKEIETKNENNSKMIKEIDKLYSLLDSAQNRTKEIKYITDFDLIENLPKRYDKDSIILEIESRLKQEQGVNHLKDMYANACKGIDSVILDMMLNANRYNVYFMNKKTRNYIAPTTTDIKFEELDVGLKEILNYLDIKEDELDNNLIFDINKYIKKDASNLKKLENFAREIKTGIGIRKSLFDRINDKNILLSILIHSNLDAVNSIENLFNSKYKEENNIKLINKIIESIPSVFIKNTFDSKSKFSVLTKYNTFINNMTLIEKYGLDIKYIVNQPVFLVNDYEKNIELINRLESINVNVKNVLEHVGNILVIKPEIVLDNIKTLSLYGISLTNDDNNNGYTLLGMQDLTKKLDYFIESEEWKKSDGKLLDNIDLIRGLIIKDGYLKWKNNYKSDKLDSASLEEKFTNNQYSDEKLMLVFEKYPKIKEVINRLDDTYLVKEEGYYAIGLQRVSRFRILRNLCNYNGKDKESDILIGAIKHKSNINNSEEVVKTIMNSLEMGDESVKLSKGL